MATILHIDASPRQERSFSRNLTKEFVTTWLLDDNDIGGEFFFEPSAQTCLTKALSP